MPKNKGTAIRDIATRNPFLFLFTDLSPSSAAIASGSSFYSSKTGLFHKTTVEKPGRGLLSPSLCRDRPHDFAPISVK
jgi:hypothetical protein